MANYIRLGILLLTFFICVTGCVNSGYNSAINSVSSPSQDQSCFKFSDEVTTRTDSGFGGQLFFLTGHLSNSCMKNYENVIVQKKFYDKDNFLLKTDKQIIPHLQHGTTVFISADYTSKPGTNNANRCDIEIVGYELQS